MENVKIAKCPNCLHDPLIEKVEHGMFSIHCTNDDPLCQVFSRAVLQASIPTATYQWNAIVIPFRMVLLAVNS